MGVYWGRFNPPHRGHLAVIRRLARRGRLVVAIGSAERRDERSNPFAGFERRRMLEAYLREARIRGVRVVTIDDGPSVAGAIDRLVRRLRPDHLFLSTEKRWLIRRAEGRVPVATFRRTGTLSSTRLRDAIAAGDPRWTRWTGRSVVAWIREHRGVERIRRAYGLAERPPSRQRRRTTV